MIEAIRTYLKTCSYIDDFIAVNVDYLVDKVNAISINEAAGYNPILNTYLNGEKEMQFQFNIDVRFRWNEELENNVKNSTFFENIRDWLEKQDEDGVYPTVSDTIPMTIGAISNGYIYLSGNDEAIYRISCRYTYIKQVKKQATV